MTVTLTTAERTLAERLHAELARQLLAQGELADPVWRAAFDRTPRHVLVPSFYEPDQAGRWRLVDGGDPTQREHWLRAVYSDQTLIIALTDVPLPAQAGGGVFQQWTSSSTLPSLVLSMLRALDLAEGHRVLEIGTGSGYNAALLCARLGHRQVATVDIDPALTGAAARRLATLGYTPTICTGDGSLGLAEHGPYDRIVATCSVRAIPRAWLEQTAPGGVILTDLRGQLGGTLVKVHNRPDGTAAGRFLPECASFMWLRHHPGTDPARTAPDITSEPAWRTTTVDPALLVDDLRFGFFAQLHLPGGRLTRTTRLSDHAPAIRLTLRDGSWSEISREPTADGQYEVAEAGPQPVWKAIEDCHHLWLALGQPSWDRFGITATPQGQHVWFDTPDSAHTWQLPDPDEPAPAYL